MAHAWLGNPQVCPANLFEHKACVRLSLWVCQQEGAPAGGQPPGGGAEPELERALPQRASECLGRLHRQALGRGGAVLPEHADSSHKQGACALSK